MTRFSLISLAMVLALGACATAPTTRQIGYDDTFATVRFGWTSTSAAQTDGATVAAFRGIDVDGQLEICGVWAHVGLAGRDFARDVLRGYVITVNDQPILRGVEFFTKASSPELFAYTPATCAATGQPVPGPNDRINLEYRGSTSFRVR